MRMLRAVLFVSPFVRCCSFGFNLFQQRLFRALRILLQRFGRPVFQSLDFRLIGWGNILDGRLGSGKGFSFSFVGAEVFRFRDDRGVIPGFRLVCIQNRFARFFRHFRFGGFRLGGFALFKVAEV